jgi:hypothetical protein
MLKQQKKKQEDEIDRIQGGIDGEHERKLQHVDEQMESLLRSSPRLMYLATVCQRISAD